MKIDKKSLLSTIHSSLTVFSINLIGKLLVSEVIALITLPFINLKKLFKNFPLLKVILFGLFALIISQTLSDIYNASSFHNIARGLSAIVFAMISIIFLVYAFSKNSKSIIIYLFILFIVRAIFGEGDFDIKIIEENSNYFKIRFVGFLNPLILVIGYYFNKTNKLNLTILTFLLFGLFCMIMDARSNGVVFLLTSILLSIKYFNIRLNSIKIILVSSVTTIILYLGYIVYVDKVLNEDFGGNNAKFQLQMTSNPYNPFELLYYGRTEIVILSEAIMDKPFFGHGSWAQDKNLKYATLHARLFKTKINRSGFIRAHSIVLGYYAYAGILGFLSITFIFMTLFYYSFKLFKNSNDLKTLPIIIFFLITMIWDFLFSPIGTLRTTFPLFAAIVITEYSRFIFKKE